MWASKYTFKDFEDDKVGPPPNLEPEPEPASQPAPPAAAPASARPAPTSTPPPPRAARPAPAPPPDADDSEFVKVLLPLGRAQGHKSASIRNLLRDYLGLEGRAIRDLTVRDTSTLFRLHQAEIERCQAQLASVVLDGVALSLERTDGAREELRAPPPPEEFEDARREPTEIRLDPLEFESVVASAAAEEPPT